MSSNPNKGRASALHAFLQALTAENQLAAIDLRDAARLAQAEHHTTLRMMLRDAEISYHRAMAASFATWCIGGKEAKAEARNAHDEACRELIERASRYFAIPARNKGEGREKASRMMKWRGAMSGSAVGWELWKGARIQWNAILKREASALGIKIKLEAGQ